jgi:hypothetical protein
LKSGNRIRIYRRVQDTCRREWHRLAWNWVLCATSDVTAGFARVPALRHCSVVAIQLVLCAVWAGSHTLGSLWSEARTASTRSRRRDIDKQIAPVDHIGSGLKKRAHIEKMSEGAVSNNGILKDRPN